MSVTQNESNANIFSHFLNKELQTSLFSAQKRPMAEMKDVARVFTVVCSGIRYPILEVIFYWKINLKAVSVETVTQSKNVS